MKFYDICNTVSTDGVALGSLLLSSILSIGIIVDESILDIDGLKLIILLCYILIITTYFLPIETDKQSIKVFTIGSSIISLLVNIVLGTYGNLLYSIPIFISPLILISFN